MNLRFQKLCQKSLTTVSLSFILLSCTSQPQISINSSTFSQDIFNYLYENRQELNLCQGEIDSQLSQNEIQTYKIDQNTQLIQFLCFLGAYQGNYQYFLYQETPRKTIIKPLSFDIFQEVETSQTIKKATVNSLGGLPNYKPENQTLEILTKYRGLGDCGSWGRYQWDKSQFKLIEYRTKTDCDGQYVEPENYELVYSEKN